MQAFCLLLLNVLLGLHSSSLHVSPIIVALPTPFRSSAGFFQGMEKGRSTSPAADPHCFSTPFRWQGFAPEAREGKLLFLVTHSSCSQGGSPMLGAAAADAIAILHNYGIAHI